jgi:mono/diheme cytochrome c family protein
MRKNECGGNIWRARLTVCLLPALVVGVGVAAAAPGAKPAARRTATIRRAASRPAPAAPIDFNRDIRPVLAKNCFACHGPDEGHRAAGLRLDLREAAIVAKPGRPAALVPGKPEQSALLRRVLAADDAGRMPPPATGHRLTATQVAQLRTWIRSGATYAEHWSFVKPKLAPLPVAKDPKLRAWPRNPIDRFVLARLERAGLRPSPPADRFALLRRVSIDLRGLPPTPQEVDAFARDPHPDAYERAVDRFLADPAYGERWARMWLDLARYADSAGYGSDPLRTTIWRYRDWVIDAFNRNLPYDQFTTEQLAGDLLPNATLEQKVATAFHRNTMTNTEGGTDDEEFRVAAVKDRVDTTAQVWMGLTVGCAKCHTHKYDPISQREYYQFYALFNQTEDNDQPGEGPLLSLATPEALAQNSEIDGKLAALRKELEVPAGAAGTAPLTEERKKALQAEIAALEKSRPALPTVPVMQELPAAKRRTTHLMVKGNFQDPSEKVEPAANAFQAFAAWPKEAPLDRLGVARWLMNRENPLTARVAVNRYWAQLFGVGLVETEEDFGTQGDLPTHPELLDWLALEYPRLGWDTKALLRLLVTSATYRQTSAVTPDRLAKDPRNRLMSRGPRYRLEAEMVRDQALALSGLLSRKRGGPSVFPPQPPGLWQAAFNGERTWATSTGEDKYRRGLYTFWRRTVPYPSMAAFDAPSRELCSVRRPRTNTPLQAFVTLNDPVYVEAAQALARRMVQEGGATPEERARYGLRLTLCRPARPEQERALVALYRAELAHYTAQPEAALAMATEPRGPLPAGQTAPELAAWTVVANVLLNQDGVLTKN